VITHAYPQVTHTTQVRLPNDGVRRCGSACAHAGCKYAGPAEGYLLGCAASATAWSACPYHACGFINVADEVPR